MNEIDEPKNVDKLCPIFGSHMIPIISKVPGVFGQQILGGDFKLLNCQKAKCELWNKTEQYCSFYWIAFKLDNLPLALSHLLESLNNIESAIRDLKEVPRGES